MHEEAFTLAELARRLENLIRFGTIIEADYAAARVRVASGQLETTWIPWLTQRALGDSLWWAPEVGERVMLICPSGDPVNAVAMPALFQQAHPAPAASADQLRAQFADGSWVEYDRVAHKFTITVNGGDVVINATGNLDAVVGGHADITAAGTVNVDGSSVHLKQGAGVVTKDCICQFTGRPHSDGSAVVTAGK